MPFRAPVVGAPRVFLAGHFRRNSPSNRLSPALASFIFPSLCKLEEITHASRGLPNERNRCMDAVLREAKAHRSRTCISRDVRVTVNYQCLLSGAGGGSPDSDYLSHVRYFGEIGA
jgi:hypothetical protein